ncbi:MAG: hypothetical protein EOM06_00045 [Sphingobacteriia bacterium]|nr:hypothetical protein [Sphingobacteriia bacterium]
MKKTDASSNNAICPKCGRSFTCNPTGKCWCSGFTIPAENLRLLKTKYSSCLCPECLQEFAVQNP